MCFVCVLVIPETVLIRGLTLSLLQVLTKPELNQHFVYPDYCLNVFNARTHV